MEQHTVKKFRESREIFIKTLRMYEEYILFLERIVTARNSFRHVLEKVRTEMVPFQGGKYFSVHLVNGIEQLSNSVISLKEHRYLNPEILMKQFDVICKNASLASSWDVDNYSNWRNAEDRKTRDVYTGKSDIQVCTSQMDNLTLRIFESLGILGHPSHSEFKDKSKINTIYELDDSELNESKVNILSDPFSHLYPGNMKKVSESVNQKICQSENFEDITHCLQDVKERKTTSYSSFNSNTGVVLSHSIRKKYSGFGIPKIVEDCVAYLYDKGLKEEGLFSCGARKDLLAQIFNTYADFIEFDIYQVNDPHLVAGLLKYWLRESKTLFSNNVLCQLHKLLPFEIWESFEKLQMIKSILGNMKIENPTNYYTLEIIVELLSHVSENSNENRMNSSNLGKVVGISFFKGKLGAEGSSQFLSCFIKNYKLLFAYGQDSFNDPQAFESPRNSGRRSCGNAKNKLER
jgi:hypothetical protein